MYITEISKTVIRAGTSNIKTKTAKYDESTHGKMKIRFSFILKNAEKSW